MASDSEARISSVHSKFGGISSSMAERRLKKSEVNGSSPFWCSKKLAARSVGFPLLQVWGFQKSFKQTFVNSKCSRVTLCRAAIWDWKCYKNKVVYGKNGPPDVHKLCSACTLPVSLVFWKWLKISNFMSWWLDPSTTADCVRGTAMGNHTLALPKLRFWEEWRRVFPFRTPVPKKLQFLGTGQAEQFTP